jgi:protein phosphatase PTC1
LYIIEQEQFNFPDFHTALSLPSFKLAGDKRRSLSGNGGLLNRMFGSSTPSVHKTDEAHPATTTTTTTTTTETKNSPPTSTSPTRPADAVTSPSLTTTDPANKQSTSKTTRRSSVSKAKDIFASARQSFSFSNNHEKPTSATNSPIPPAMHKLSKVDPALSVPTGSHNNQAGESVPGPHSTFRVGVTEDKNKKCRRTMEDTHAYLYNFLSTPRNDDTHTSTHSSEVADTDNGYFAIFDGHAGTFAADWCGKKLHLLLEETIRKNPTTPIPELLDQTFTSVDLQLEKLPVKNSGTTAVTAVLRWEDRVPNPASATGSAYISQAAMKATEAATEAESTEAPEVKLQQTEAKLRQNATRQRVLYTANVGDARIVLSRSGRALRLSYDHKGSDESEGRRIANAGGLILNNRVNGVLAVTRALGDSYMKEFVTGHPYTTETVIQPDTDEFLILACDGVSLPTF